MHVDARRAEAGLAHHHLRRARPAARPRHPRRGDVACCSAASGDRPVTLPEPRAGRPLVMGVVNVTPDSFSDGGAWFTPEAAVAHGRELVAQGADLVDVGGESTRPGAERVDAAEELRRVVPVVAALAAAGVPCQRRHDARRGGRGRAGRPAPRSSTTSAAGSPTPRWPPLVARARRAVRAMHWRGHSRDDAARARSTTTSSPTCAPSCGARVEALVAAGVAPGAARARPRARLRQARRAQLGAAAPASTSSSALGHPVLVGTSRKTFLGPAARATPTAPPARPRARRRHAGHDRARRAGTARGACACTTSSRTVDALDVVEALRGPRGATWLSAQ